MTEGAGGEARRIAEEAVSNLLGQKRVQTALIDQGMPQLALLTEEMVTLARAYLSLLTENHRLGEDAERECNWLTDEDGVYHTTCGNAFVFDSGTATENGAKFCQYCRGKLIDAALTPARSDG